MLFHSFSFPKALTSCTKFDFQNREFIRSAALAGWPSITQAAKYWGIWIEVHRCSTRKNEFDLDNALKLVVDAFCKEQFRKHDINSQFKQVGLFENDSIETVPLLGARGKMVGGPNVTFVEIRGWAEGEKIEF